MTAAKNVREALDRDTAIGLIEFWWRCVEAGREIDGDDALADDAVILHYSGCGASAIVTAGHFRALLSATAAGDADLLNEVNRRDAERYRHMRRASFTVTEPEYDAMIDAAIAAQESP